MAKRLSAAFQSCTDMVQFDCTRLILNSSIILMIDFAQALVPEVSTKDFRVVFVVTAYSFSVDSRPRLRFAVSRGFSASKSSSLPIDKSTSANTDMVQFDCTRLILNSSIILMIDFAQALVPEVSIKDF